MSLKQVEKAGTHGTHGTHWVKCMIFKGFMRTSFAIYLVHTWYTLGTH